MLVDIMNLTLVRFGFRCNFLMMNSGISEECRLKKMKLPVKPVLSVVRQVGRCSAGRKWTGLALRLSRGVLIRLSSGNKATVIRNVVSSALVQMKKGVWTETVTMSFFIVGFTILLTRNFVRNRFEVWLWNLGGVICSNRVAVETANTVEFVLLILCRISSRMQLAVKLVVRSDSLMTVSLSDTTACLLNWPIV